MSVSGAVRSRVDPGVVVNATLIVTALSYAMVAAIAVLAPFVGGALSLVVLLSAWRYAYELLRALAQGHRVLPPPDFDTVNPFGRWSYTLHIVAFAGAIICMRLYLPAWWIFAALIAAVLPASAALIALTGRLESAFSPAAGYPTLRQFLAAQGDSPEAHYRLVEHLLHWEDTSHALGVAARLLDAELAHGRPANAFDLWRRCRRIRPGLAPAPPAAAALAAYARSIGQHGPASELDEMARSPAASPDAPDA